MQMMKLPGGRRLSPYLLTTGIETDHAMRNYCIEQHASDRIVIRYRPRSGETVDEVGVVRRVRDVVGGVAVSCRCDPALAPTGSGKRSVYRDLSPPQE